MSSSIAPRFLYVAAAPPGGLVPQHSSPNHGAPPPPPPSPPRSITLRVVSLPSEGFDGEATVSFEADGMPPGDASSSSPALDVVSSDGGGGGDDDAAISVETVTQQGAGGGSGAASAVVPFSTNSDTAVEEEGGAGVQAAAPGASVSFDVAFYHCDAGEFWTSIEGGSAGGGGATSCGSEVSDSCCQLCSDFVEGSDEVRGRSGILFLFMYEASYFICSGWSVSQQQLLCFVFFFSPCYRAGLPLSWLLPGLFRFGWTLRPPLFWGSSGVVDLSRLLWRSLSPS